MSNTNISEILKVFNKLFNQFGFNENDFYAINISFYSEIRLQGHLDFDTLRRYENAGFVFEYDKKFALTGKRQIDNCNVEVIFTIK